MHAGRRLAYAAAGAIAGGAIVALALAGILQALGIADTALGALCLTPAP